LVTVKQTSENQILENIILCMSNNHYSDHGGPEDDQESWETLLGSPDNELLVDTKKEPLPLEERTTILETADFSTQTTLDYRCCLRNGAWRYCEKLMMGGRYVCRKISDVACTGLPTC
jgi:hypothetical protein